MKYQLHLHHGDSKTKIDYGAQLNPEQWEVVKNAKGPCLILAGAGSGKTRTLVYCTAYLLEQKIQPGNIMLVTFTNKAAREMLNRVELLLKYHPQGLWGGTFHHLANIVLRKYANRVGFHSNFTIFDKEDSKTFLKNCIGELGLNTKKEYFPKADVVHSVLSFKQNDLSSIEEVVLQKFSHLKPEIIPHLEKIYLSYQEKKRRMNAMDFDDLLYYWRLLLKENQEARQRLSSQLYYILVDEYQDTNTIQAEIIEMLAQVHRNVVVVGDDSQSIYSFRAANIKNILEFPKKFPDAKIFKLETNYRSTPEILEVANASIQCNQTQYEKQLKSVKKSSAKPAHVALGDSYQEAEFICQRILELQEEGVPLNSMAVLFRAAYQALELELELNKKNIPYEMRGGIRFFEQAHVKDVVAYLKIFNNMKDELSWKRVLQLYRGIGPAAAQRIWEHIEKFSELSLLVARPENLGLGAKQQESFLEILEVFQKLLVLKEEFIPSAIDTILRLGYKKYVEASFENAKDRIEDLEQLANFALSYKNLDEFLSEVTLSEAFRGETQADSAQNDEALILTTIHQAKGLEWKIVFVLGLVDGQFPHYKVFASPMELEEERRLFYVAVTRAQDELYLTYPVISTSFRTGQSINRPSLFLKEIDEKLFEKWDVEGNFDLPTITYDDDNPRPGILKMIDNI